MRHACLTLKERLFMPNTLEKLLKKSSARTWLICHVQYTTCWLHGLKKPNGYELTPAASGRPDSTRATSPTDRYVKSPHSFIFKRLLGKIELEKSKSII